MIWFVQFFEWKNGNGAVVNSGNLSPKQIVKLLKKKTPPFRAAEPTFKEGKGKKWKKAHENKIWLPCVCPTMVRCEENYKTSLSAVFYNILCMLLLKNAFNNKQKNIEKDTFYPNSKQTPGSDGSVFFFYFTVRFKRYFLRLLELHFIVKYFEEKHLLFSPSALHLFHSRRQSYLCASRKREKHWNPSIHLWNSKIVCPISNN